VYIERYSNFTAYCIKSSHEKKNAENTEFGGKIYGFYGVLH